MDSTRNNLLTFGYVREYCKSENIQLIPDDIMGLFVIWLSFPDCFDKNVTHPMSNITTIDNQYPYHQHLSLNMEYASSNFGEWASAVGQTITQKGTKYEWRFKINGPLLYAAEIQIGIMDNDMINLKQPIRDFCRDPWNGWGLYLYSMTKYHIDTKHGGFFDYGGQFEYKQGDIITMILDLSQTENENAYGVLSFDIDAEMDAKKEHITNNILYDNLDINKKYRMVVCVAKVEQDADEISLLL